MKAERPAPPLRRPGKGLAELAAHLVVVLVLLYVAAIVARLGWETAGGWL